MEEAKLKTAEDIRKEILDTVLEMAKTKPKHILWDDEDLWNWSHEVKVDIEALTDTRHAGDVPGDDELVKLYTFLSRIKHFIDKVYNRNLKNECEEWMKKVEKMILSGREQTKPTMPELTDEEPYFGWCDVKGCDNEGANGGNCWNDTGYWTVCSKHASDYRSGKPQPEMKQSAIDRENSRNKITGRLPQLKNK